MKTTKRYDKQLFISEAQREEILKYFSEVNVSKICKQVGLSRNFVLCVLNNRARETNRYTLFAELVRLAKQEYEEKKTAIESIGKILNDKINS